MRASLGVAVVYRRLESLTAFEGCACALLCEGCMYKCVVGRHGVHIFRFSCSCRNNENLVAQQEFLSWLWIDTHDEAIARDVVERARAAGVPVRSGAPGYNLPTYFRAAVRSKELRATLLKALKPLSSA